jgi:hypothetical protein
MPPSMLAPADALQGERCSHDVLAQCFARGLAVDACPTLDGEPGVFPAEELAGEVGIQQALLEEQGDGPASAKPFSFLGWVWRTWGP